MKLRDSDKPIVAVDFGTSTMLVAVRISAEDPDPVIPIGETTRWMPSLVGIDDQGSYVFGEDAERLPPDQVIRSIKTLLGRTEEAEDIALPPAFGSSPPIDDLIGRLIGVALDRAKRKAGPEVRPFLEPPLRIHLGCPANWTSVPRLRLGEIARRAGFEVSPDEIIDEPIAAGVSWLVEHFAAGKPVPEGRTLVFDYGGGTLDVAVIEVERGTGADRPMISVLAAEGLPEAGDRLDDAIFNDLESEIESSRWIGFRDPVEIEQLIKRAARQLKHALSDVDEHAVNVPGLDGLVSYTRQQLEEAFRPQLDAAMKFVFSQIKSSVARQPKANYSRIRNASDERLADEVAHVLLVGGMSRIPLVSEELTTRFKRELLLDPHDVEPENAVVSGLTSRDVLAGLNIHRPPFKFVAQYLTREGKKIGEQVLYEPYTPLYSPTETLFRIGDLNYCVSLEVPDGAHEVRVDCRTLSGRPVELTQRGTSMTLKVELPHFRRLKLPGSKKPKFQLYLDGRILLTGKKPVVVRVQRWPVVADGLAAELHVEPPPGPRPWYGRGSDPTDYHYNR